MNYLAFDLEIYGLDENYQMSNATITPYTAILCHVTFPYDKIAKDTVKALPGATYADGAWLVPILHLPRLKLIFAGMTVAPAVVASYHELLRRMRADLTGHEHRRGALGQHIGEVLSLHAVGLATLHQTAQDAPKRTKTAQDTNTTLPDDSRPVSVAQEESQFALLLRSLQGAVKAEERKASFRQRRNHWTF